MLMIFLSVLLGVSVLVFLWARKDTKAALKREHIESFAVLMFVFAISFVLVYSLDFVGSNFNLGVPFFLEELVKVIALLLGLGFAGKRFNELSDGILYAVFAALGFIFYENVMYIPMISILLDGYQLVVLLVFGRGVFTFAAHLFTAIFGFFYAFAYLRSSKLPGVSRVKPWQIVRHVRILWRQFGLLFFLWVPVSPFVTLWKFISKQTHRLSIPELLWSGLLSATYLHVGYDFLLALNVPVLSGVVLFIVGVSMYAMYRYFPKLDVIVS